MTTAVRSIEDLTRVLDINDLLDELRRRVEDGKVSADRVMTAIGYEDEGLAAYSTEQLRDELESRDGSDLMIDSEDLRDSLHRIRMLFLNGQKDRVVEAAHQLYLDALPVSV